MTDTEGKVKIGIENAEAQIKRSPNSWEFGTSEYPIFKKGFWWSQELKIRENIERKSVRLGDHSTQILTLSQKKLFVESKNGKLDVLKEELENHLRITYSDDLNSIPIHPLRDLPKPQDPTVMFDDSGIKLKKEISSIRPTLVVPWAWMGYRTSYIKTTHVSSGNSLYSFSRFERRMLYHRNSVWLIVFGYQRKCSQKVSQIFT